MSKVNLEYISNPIPIQARSSFYDGQMHRNITDERIHRHFTYELFLPEQQRVRPDEHRKVETLYIDANILCFCPKGEPFPEHIYFMVSINSVTKASTDRRVINPAISEEWERDQDVQLWQIDGIEATKDAEQIRHFFYQLKDQLNCKIEKIAQTVIEADSGAINWKF